MATVLWVCCCFATDLTRHEIINFKAEITKGESKNYDAE
jgi:hypothetical protein